MLAEAEARPGFRVQRFLVPLKMIEYGVHEDLIITYPNPCSIYLRGTIGFRGLGSRRKNRFSFSCLPKEEPINPKLGVTWGYMGTV